MNVYEIVTEKVLAELEKGVIPWLRPWSGSGMAKNFTTKKEYRGINAFLLPVLSQGQEYFATFNQIKELGGSIKKGSKGYPVVFFKWTEAENKSTGEIESFPILRYYSVFDPSQWEGVSAPTKENARPFNPIEEAERIIEKMPQRPTLSYDGGARAYYMPLNDSIHLPKKELFKTDHGYYETAFHELGHSTGHKSRLNRHKEEETDFHFGSAQYAKEELVAEMTASFLCAKAGIDMHVIQNAAAYVGSWLKALRNDKRMVVIAAAQAQKAADFILGVKKENETGVTK